MYLVKNIVQGCVDSIFCQPNFLDLLDKNGQKRPETDFLLHLVNVSETISVQIKISVPLTAQHCPTSF